MRELILIVSYILCAFAPVLLIKRIRTGFSPVQFWGAWLVSLTGAFSGGLLGSLLLARAGLYLSFPLDILPAMAGAWLFCYLFLTLREMPGNW